MDNLEYLMDIIWSIYIYISLKIYKRARRCACAMSATSALEQLPPNPQRGEHFNILYFNTPNPQRGLNLQYLIGGFASRIIPCVFPQYSIGVADSCIIYIRCVCRACVWRVRTAIFISPIYPFTFSSE